MTITSAPIQQPVLNEKGRFNRPWINWLWLIWNTVFGRVGTVTLTANTTTTVVNDGSVNTESHITFTAKTAAAATEAGGGAMYVTPAIGSFTITHANNASTTRIFSYGVHGK